MRALTYRLESVHKLMGAHPADSAHRYMLQTAVIGARLSTGPPQRSETIAADDGPRSLNGEPPGPVLASSNGALHQKAPRHIALRRIERIEAL